MSKAHEDKHTVFRPEKARWLREEGGKELTDGQRALLLAMAKLEQELGRELSTEEQAALQALGAQMEAIDPATIAEAVRQMVEAPADPARKTSWPELKRRHKS